MLKKKEESVMLKGGGDEKWQQPQRQCGKKESDTQRAREKARTHTA